MKRIKHSPEYIKDILGKVVKKLEAKKRGNKGEILKSWGDITGDIASHARPVIIKQQVLTVEVDSSAWLYALNLKKRKILEDIKKAVGEEKIKDIRFKIGEVRE